MRQVSIPSLGRSISAIGFGCASLGSRVSPQSGGRAVARALDLGVVWFDVAPPYGDGRAEGLLGGFLRGRRHDVVVCTKFGIGRPNISLLRRLLRPLARRVVATFPGLRANVGKARPVGQPTPIETLAIEASVEQSLRQLKTDYIDVLAIHEPSIRDAQDTRIFEIVRRLLERGLVRAVSIAGSPDAILASIDAGQKIDFAQFPNSLINDNASGLRRALPPEIRPHFVTHGVFSGLVPARSPALDENIRRLSVLSQRLELALPDDPAGQFLYHAFCENPDGVVVTSMIEPRHIELNCRIAARRPVPEWAEEVRAHVDWTTSGPDGQVRR